MSEGHSFLTAVLGELNRRRVLRTVGAYAVAVFVLLQLMDAAVEPLLLPAWLPTVVVLVAILGFPAVFMLAWYFDIGSGGIRHTNPEGLLTRGQNAAVFGTMMLVMVGLAWLCFGYYTNKFDTLFTGETAGGRQFTAPQNSIAVLPFADLSAQGNQGYLADGVSEEILNLLAQVDGLNVAARTSSFAFRDSNTDIREIGRLLNVRTVLEGSVRTSGDRIRLTAQLINVEDGFHIWSKYYDSEMTDIFTIQDEVASNIALALVDSFEGLSVSSESQTDSLAASQAYRTGRLHWWRRTPEELQKAVEFFARALEHDARFAPAYAALADTYLLLALYGNITSIKAAEKAQPMVEKALAIDPESAEAFAALGLARWQIGQMDAAESALRHAVDLNADYIPAQLWLAGVLGEMGRYPEESLVLEQAMVRDPLNELLRVNYTNNLSVRGHWEQARDVMAEMLAMRPDSTILLRFMAKQELSNGNLVEGWRLADRAYRLQPDNPEDIAVLAHTWIKLGQPEEAERLLLEGLESAPNNSTLRGAYGETLLVSRRFEEARRLLREMRADYGEQAPPAMQARFDFQMGVLALLSGEYDTALDYLLASINDEENPAWSGAEIEKLTLASLTLGYKGEAERAQEFLARADRLISRARLNGVDNWSIYYSEGVLLTLRGDKDRAIEKLQQAYERGFREQWVLEIDSRLDPLRDRPEFLVFKDQVSEDLTRAVSEIRSASLAAL
ncbi:MAG: tetratricopeptide repeat protein [Xanthomonadales bacterium]|jgi:TolB-like protein/Flp pilus assembly protein TadD|nr:tetratricopeptide repeat protein [Xanthomonadales bacterium]